MSRWKLALRRIRGLGDAMGFQALFFLQPSRGHSVLEAMGDTAGPRRNPQPRCDNGSAADPLTDTPMTPTEPYRFEYSSRFEDMVRRLHRGKEDWPRYETYLAHHLGGPDSRLSAFVTWLCPEIELRCGELSTKRVLDFGCGTGATTVALARKAREVVGFDIHGESLELNRRRLAEHGLAERVRLFQAEDFRQVVDRMGTFDLILVNDVLEHVPLSRPGLRRALIRELFGLLDPGGVLYIHQSPNRLWPRDVHTTSLWWIPWTRPGSRWAYRRAVARGAHEDNPETHSSGPLGLEQRGAWGITYFELKRYLEGLPHEVINTRPGQARHVSLLRPARSFRRRLWDAVLYHGLCRWSGIPLTAFSPMILHLAFRRLEAAVPESDQRETGSGLSSRVRPSRPR